MHAGHESPRATPGEDNGELVCVTRRGCFHADVPSKDRSLRGLGLDRRPHAVARIIPPSKTATRPRQMINDVSVVFLPRTPTSNKQQANSLAVVSSACKVAEAGTRTTGRTPHCVEHPCGWFFRRFNCVFYIDMYCCSLDRRTPSTQTQTAGPTYPLHPPITYVPTSLSIPYTGCGSLADRRY